MSFVLSLLSFSLLFPVRHRGHSQKIHEFRSRQDIDHSLGISQFVHTCVVGSPLREDSPAGSPYALSASSPEQSLSSLSSPSSRHLIHRESPDLRDAEEDDHHTVKVPLKCAHSEMTKKCLGRHLLPISFSQKSVGVNI